MALAQTNRVILRSVKENDWGSGLADGTTVTGAHSIGASTISVSTGATGEVHLVNGDVIRFAGDNADYTVQATVKVAKSSTGSISISPTLGANISDGAAVTVQLTMKTMPFTSEEFSSNQSSVQAESIRADRNLQDLIRVGGDAAGSINMELIYGEYDEYLQGALFDGGTQWGANALNITGTNLALTGATITDTGNGFGNVTAGQWVRISGATTTANNGDYKVASAAAGTLTLADEAGAAASFTADAPIASLHIYSAQLRNGTTRSSFTIEKNYSDITQFRQFRGMVVNELSLEIASRSKITGSFSFLGKGQTQSQVTAATVATTSATTNSVMNASANVGTMKFGNLTATYKNLSLTVNNNVRAQDAIGTPGAVGASEGQFLVSGNLTAYLEDNTLLDEFLNDNANELTLKVTDPAGNSMFIVLPRVKFSDENANAGGQNDDVMQELGFSAIVDATSTFSMQLNQLVA